MKFAREDLKELAWRYVTDSGLSVVTRDIYDHTRWSVHYRMVFKFQERYFETHYSTGATETQDEYPYDYCPDQIECQEVVPQEKTVIEYVPLNG